MKRRDVIKVTTGAGVCALAPLAGMQATRLVHGRREPIRLLVKGMVKLRTALTHIRAGSPECWHQAHVEIYADVMPTTEQAAEMLVAELRRRLLIPNDAEVEAIVDQLGVSIPLPDDRPSVVFDNYFQTV